MIRKARRVLWSARLAFYAGICCVVCVAIMLSCDGSVLGSAWFAPSTLKITKDAKPFGGPTEWEMTAARNEDEACQLVLLSDRALRGVRVTASGLKHSSGKGILKASLNRVAYVPAGKSLLPDPLPPIQPLDLQPGQAQPVWITVRVPADARPGVYRGTVKVQAGTETRAYPLSIRVWDFALPVTPSCTTAFTLWVQEGLAPMYGIEPAVPNVPMVGPFYKSPKLRSIYRKYADFLLDHKISSMGDTCEMLYEDVMSEDFASSLDDPRRTSIGVPYNGIASDEAMRAIYARLVERGWLRKAFCAAVDEPKSREQYDQLASAAERLRRIEPRCRLLSPCNQPYPKLDEKNTPAVELMYGKVTMWCPVLNTFDQDPESTSFLKARQKAGEPLWWYVACGPGHPYPNLMADWTGMDHRMLFWLQKKEGVEGLLYWGTTYWGGGDPWRSLSNVPWIGDTYYGDGLLLYPGQEVGVDGPVSSIRLEMIRDGIEDFDYLTLADQRLGPDATKQYISRLATSLTEYSQDSMKLEAVRRDLGAALEKATREMRRKL